MRLKSAKFLSCLLLGIVLGGPAARGATAQTPDEAALRALVGEYYAAFAGRDAARLFGLWAEKAAGLAERKQAVAQTFAAHGQIEARGLTVLRLAVENDKASARARVEIIALDAKTGRPNPDFGAQNRAFGFIREAGGWKIAREAAAEEDLAAELAARAGAERDKLLDAEKELQNGELVRQLLRQGRRLYDQGQRAQGVELDRFALALAVKMDNKAAQARAHNSLGGLFFSQGDYPQALSAFRAALALYEALADDDGVARALGNVAVIQRAQGDYGAALAALQRAVALTEKLGDQQVLANQLNSLGLIHYEQGDYQPAVERFQQSLRLKEKIGDKSGIAATLNNLGILRAAEGRYREASVYYQQAMALRKELKQPGGIADALLNLGLMHKLQGKFDLALDFFQQCRAIRESLGDKAGLGLALNNIGIIYGERQDWAAALEFYRQSLPLREAVGDKAGQAQTLNNIGQAHAGVGNYQAAREALEKSLALREAMSDKSRLALTLKNLSELYVKQGQGEPALHYAERAVQVAREFNTPEVLWQGLSAAAYAHRLRQQPEQAQAAANEAISLVEGLRAQVAGSQLERQSFLENKVAPYRLMVELLLAQNRQDEALAYVERAKARVLLDVLRQGKTDISKAMTPEEAAQERRLTANLAALNEQLARAQTEAARAAKVQEQIRRARLELEAFQSDLYAAHPDLQVQRGEAPALTPAQAGALLPDASSALLEYFVTDDNAYLFVITRGAARRPLLRVYQLNIKTAELTRRAEEFRHSLAQRDLGFLPAARGLYDLLLKPAEPQLKGVTTLVIVPDGGLWNLPFQALQSGARRYLWEDCVISYAPSLTVLSEMKRLRRNDKGVPSLLAVGNPSSGAGPAAATQAGGALGDLPESERQARALQKLYGAASSAVFTGAEAREETVKSQAEKYRLLQFATHGVLNDANPMYSYLALADGGGEDGQWEAWEMMKLNLRADLVVLSACETARGRVGAGEGLMGMTWALFVAGAPQTVVSQWKIETASATDLMLEFHRQLKAKPRPATAAALRLAALKLLRTDEYRHPFYWAGFIMVGDNR
jgi:CHAT domain-containing protein